MLQTHWDSHITPDIWNNNNILPYGTFTPVTALPMYVIAHCLSVVRCCNTFGVVLSIKCTRGKIYTCLVIS